MQPLKLPFIVTSLLLILTVVRYDIRSQDVTSPVADSLSTDAASDQTVSAETAEGSVQVPDTADYKTDTTQHLPSSISGTPSDTEAVKKSETVMETDLD